MRVLLVEEAEHTEVFPDCQLGVLAKGQKFQPNDGDPDSGNITVVGHFTVAACWG